VRLLLASASPRRAELLTAAGIEFDALPANVDEVMDIEETPEGYARRLAQLKAEAIKPRAGERPILGADTIVLVDNEVLGKPADAEDARRMLRLLSGREHAVLTAVCLINPEGPAEAGPYVREFVRWRVQTLVARTTVEFAPLTPEEIDWYVASGEPMDKAGGYAIQGLASRFVTRIHGSYSNVVGLPVSVVYHLCTTAGLLVS
jgi:septum formation protein